MQAQFARIGVPFTRIAAVDAALLIEEEIDAFRSSVADAYRPHSWGPGPNRDLSKSQRRSGKRLHPSDDSYAAVFEDDVHLSDRIAALLKNSTWIHDSVDIVRFETTLQGMTAGAGSPFPSLTKLKSFGFYSGAWGAAGYVIKREIAEWLTCIPKRIYEPVDWLLFHPRSALASAISIYQVDPAPCVQDHYHPDPVRRQDFGRQTPLPTGLMRSYENRGPECALPCR